MTGQFLEARDQTWAFLQVPDQALHHMATMIFLRTNTQGWLRRRGIFASIPGAQMGPDRGAIIGTVDPSAAGCAVGNTEAEVGTKAGAS